MSRVWIDNSFIKGLNGKEGLSLIQSPLVSRSTDDSREFVNELLERERYTYISSKDKAPRIVGKDEVAFDFTVTSINDIDSGEELRKIPFGAKVTLLGDSKILFQDTPANNSRRVTYDNVRIEERKCIGVASLASIFDTAQNKPTYRVLLQKGGEAYIPIEEIEEEDIYRNASMRNISLMELTHIGDIDSDIERIGVIQKYFQGIDINTPDFFDTLNRIFEKANKILSQRAPHLTRRIPYEKIRRTKFSSPEDIIRFLDGVNSTDRQTSVIHCTLLKYLYLLYQYSQNPVYQLLEQIELGSFSVEDFIRRTFNLPKEVSIRKDSRGLYIFEKEFPEYSTTIQIGFRVKTLDSIIAKALSKGDYLYLEDFEDIFGISVYIPEKSKKYTLEIMNEFDQHIYAGVAKIKNKGLLNSEILKLHSKISRKTNFSLEKYQAACNKTSQKSVGTGDAYLDTKQIGKHTLALPSGEVIKVGTETKYLHGRIEEDTNETGMSFHPVYDYFAKHFEGEKNRNPFITARNISELLDDFFPYLLDILKNKYPDKKILQLLQEIYNELIIEEAVKEIYSKYSPKEKFSDFLTAYKNWRKEKDNKKGDDNKRKLFEQIDTNIYGRSNFPTDLFSENDIQRFYDSSLKKLIFYHLARKYKLQVVKVEGTTLAFTTEYNREQLESGGRGYIYKKPVKFSSGS